MKFFILVAASGLFFASGNVMAIETNCQTAAEIRRHVESDLASDEFCLHSVSDPTSSLVSDSPISPDLQLAPNLEVAFLNSQKAFGEARTACASLGSGWHRPASRHEEADPRAVDNSDSLEGLARYFIGLTFRSFWSGSTQAYSRNQFGLHVKFDEGLTRSLYKGAPSGVVCVRR